MKEGLNEIFAAIREWDSYGDIIGPGDPAKVGQGLFDFVSKHIPLKPDMRILDLGCGLGRSSAPFADYLSDKGRLIGVDVVESMVDFATKEITSRYPNSSFYTCEVPDSYLPAQQKDNKAGLPKIKDVLVREAPYDLVLAFSVFTHLTPEEMDEYFTLFDRVLTSGGYLVLTFLFLDQWTRPQIQNRELPSMVVGDTPDPMPKIGNVCYASPANPRAVVSVAIEEVFNMVKVRGFQPLQIIFGSWRAISSDIGQDTIILQRVSKDQLPEDFNPAQYLKLNPDVAASKINPVHHYLQFGRKEGRKYR